MNRSDIDVDVSVVEDENSGIDSEVLIELPGIELIVLKRKNQRIIGPDGEIQQETISEPEVWWRRPGDVEPRGRL